MIELETTKLGGGGDRVKNLSPLDYCHSLATQVVTIYANQLANDPFVGLRVAINEVHRS